MQIRPGTLRDVPGVVGVHLAAWDAAKDGLDLATRPDAERRTDRWTEFVDSGEGALLVADEDGVVGFISYGPSRDEDRVGEREVYTLYVAPEWWGRGIGSALLDRVPADGPVSIWVAERNARARSLYARHGFVPDGATDPGHHVPVLRMARQPTPSS
ncbi:MAG: GNAT family N-acetyltransferase [Candidatus Nanopelagicales bacterium]